MTNTMFSAREVLALQATTFTLLLWNQCVSQSDILKAMHLGVILFFFCTSKIIIGVPEHALGWFLPTRRFGIGYGESAS